VEPLGGDRLEATLRQVGRSAPAAVSHAAWTPTVRTGEEPAHGGETRTATWRLRLQVEPDDETPFDATLTEVIPLGEEIAVGQRIPVLFDPEDHRRVAIDHTERRGSLTVEARPSAGATSAASASDPTPLLGRRKPGPGEPTTAPQGMLAHPSAGGPRLTDVSRAKDGASREPAEDRLARLADLWDRGALTSAEFERRKRQILGL
jgi:hypothetical protein